MDRAKAIRYLESMATDLTGACVAAQSDKVSEYIARKIQAVDMAIAALREQEQREQGCEYCQEDSEGYRTVFGAYSISNPFHGANWQIRGGNLRTHEIHFCPMCGRKLPEV